MFANGEFTLIEDIFWGMGYEFSNVFSSANESLHNEATAHHELDSICPPISR